MLFSNGYLQSAYEYLLPQIRKNAEECIRLRGSGSISSNRISLLAEGYVRMVAASRGGFLEHAWEPQREMPLIVVPHLRRIVLKEDDETKEGIPINPGTEMTRPSAVRLRSVT